VKKSYGAKGDNHGLVLLYCWCSLLSLRPTESLSDSVDDPGVTSPMMTADVTLTLISREIEGTPIFSIDVYDTKYVNIEVKERKR